MSKREPGDDCRCLGAGRRYYTMRILAVSVFCLAAALLAAQSSHPNFSGKWRIDPTRMQEHATVVANPPQGAPAIPPPPPPEHQYTVEQIEQSGSVLKISGGEAGTTAVYTIDPSGKEVSDSIGPEIVRVAKSHWDNGRIVTEWQMVRNGEVVMQGTDT